jgi:carboxyl-terminal processing protease
MQRPRPAVAPRVLLAIVLALACCFSVPVAPRAQEQTAQDQPPSIDLETPWGRQSVDLTKLYDAVVDTVERRFFDEARLKELNWRTRTDALRPSVLAAVTAEDAIRQINALLSELKTSHTGLFTPNDYEYYILLDILGPDRNLNELMARRFWGSGPYYPGIGMFTRQIDGRHFIDGILEGSPAERAGLKYGDEILSVDGLPYSPIFAFRGKIGATVALEIRRDANGAPQRLEASVVPVRPVEAFASATAASARIIERDGTRMGYVHIWSSNESATFKAALDKFEPRNIVQDRLHAWGVRIMPNVMTDAMREMMKPPNPLDFLIVDIRGRVGGNIGVVAKYLELLDARETPYWGHERFLQRSDARLRMGIENTPRNPPFRGRSALLIDHHARSAAELMAYGYKRGAFGPLIGTTTAGAVTSGSLSVMPGDLLLYVAIAGHELNGQPIEGIGVSPDHRVERPLAYAAGADPVLDAAVELLAKRAPK